MALPEGAACATVILVVEVKLRLYARRRGKEPKDLRMRREEAFRVRTDSTILYIALRCRRQLTVADHPAALSRIHFSDGTRKWNVETFLRGFRRWLAGTDRTTDRSRRYKHKMLCQRSVTTLEGAQLNVSHAMSYSFKKLSLEEV